MQKLENMKKILDFLGAAKVFFFATVDGGRPRVRPFGFYMEHQGRLYFGMGTHKEVWKQLAANPYVEICAHKPGGMDWVRVSGKAVVDANPDTVKTAFAKAPFLKDIYSKESGLTLGLVYLEGGAADFMGQTGKLETVTF